MLESERLEKYDAWSLQKKALSIRSEKFLFKEGEIWWSSIGMNLGSESFGKGETFRRPVLIVKKLSGDSCIAIPLTSQKKIGSWFVDITIHSEKKWVMLYQIRMIHTKRFQRRMASLDEKDFMRVKEKLEELLELSSDHHSVETEIGGYIPKVDLVYSEWIKIANSDRK